MKHIEYTPERAGVHPDIFQTEVEWNMLIPQAMYGIIPAMLLKFLQLKNAVGYSFDDFTTALPDEMAMELLKYMTKAHAKAEVAPISGEVAHMKYYDLSKHSPHMDLNYIKGFWSGLVLRVAKILDLIHETNASKQPEFEKEMMKLLFVFLSGLKAQKDVLRERYRYIVEYNKLIHSRQVTDEALKEYSVMYQDLLERDKTIVDAALGQIHDNPFSIEIKSILRRNLALSDEPSVLYKRKPPNSPAINFIRD